MPFLQGADLPLSYYYSKYTTSTVGCQYLEGKRFTILFTLTNKKGNKFVLTRSLIENQ